MATGGADLCHLLTRNHDTQAGKGSTRKCRIAGVRKCDRCEKTSEVTMVKWFCRSCDLILCCDCADHVPEDKTDPVDDHEGFTFGEAAKQFCEEIKQKTDDILMTIGNLHNEYDSYRVYLEGVAMPIQEDIHVCASTTPNKRDEEIKNETTRVKNYLEGVSSLLQENTGASNTNKEIKNETICVKNSLRKLEWCKNTANRVRDAVKGLYDQRDAFGIVQNIGNWDREFGEIVETSPDLLTSRIHVTAKGSHRRIRPSVAGIKLHDRLHEGWEISEPEQVKRAWMMHAGQLFVYEKGDFNFWDAYPRSQIRPFITEGCNGEVMVFLKQISGYCGSWEEFDEEISGTPAGYTWREGKYGNTFSLDKERNLLLVMQNGHVTKRLPLPGENDYTPSEFSIDSERDMVCVLSHDDTYEEDNIFVFKIEYGYDLVAAQSLETSDDLETADAQVASNPNSTCTFT